uniref:Uncharacterized protein n=1 Tax=Neobodo designis TaxID=312471 RepID=A0A7S1W6Z4_NEODS|mmetsp:Transcript_54875/g.169145  ORF Transcript_54875/g.169145 Transcript_54875/m.169145 type:complete len:345 (+) Transcript_54875:185-1219(+)
MSALHVVDLGLDFKAFASYTDDKGRQLIGNQFHFNVAEVAAKFAPTCGLLTAVLHGYAATASTAIGRVWLDQYRLLQQKLFDETKSPESANTIAFLGQFPSPLVGPLFEMLDRQVGMSGHNAPSQRRLNADSKHPLCNLHLNEKACHQGFHCNQLHLAATSDGEPVHRHEFYTRVVEVLMARGYDASAVKHRVMDAMFFARYGNRVTVEVQGQHYQFFKTNYTDARLNYALHLPTEGTVSVPAGTHPHKPQRLPVDGSVVFKELSAAADDLISERASPTTRKWNAVIASFVEPDAANVPIDPDLARQIVAASAASGPAMEPSGSDDGITPLINSVHRKTFEQSV